MTPQEPSAPSPEVKQEAGERFYCRLCRTLVPFDQVEDSPSNCATGLSHNGPQLTDDPRDVVETCWGVVEKRTSAPIPECSEPQTQCSSTYSCGPECCGTELWRCDLPTGHAGDHTNTMTWSVEAGRRSQR